MYRWTCIFILLVAVWILMAPSLVLSGQPVIVAFSEFPPYKMLIDGKHAGIDLDILSEISKRLDLTLSFKNGTLEECLRMMERGEADLMTSLLRRPERENYIHYVQPRYLNRSEKVFYVLTGRQELIRSYDDLSNLRIGVKAGARYSPMFDTDKTLNKIQAPDINSNLQRLLAGEIDTFLDTLTEGDYWVTTLGYAERVSKSTFKFEYLDPIYMGIAKASPLVKRSHEIGKVLKDMLNKGTVEQFREKYLK